MKKYKIITLLTAVTLLAACGKTKVDPTPTSSNGGDTPTTSEMSGYTPAIPSSGEEAADPVEEYQTYIDRYNKTYAKGSGAFTIKSDAKMTQVMDSSGYTVTMGAGFDTVISTDGRENFYRIYSFDEPDDYGVMTHTDRTQVIETQDGHQTKYSYDSSAKDSASIYESYKLSDDHVTNISNLDYITDEYSDMYLFDPCFNGYGEYYHDAYGSWPEEDIAPDLESLTGTVLYTMSRISETVDKSYNMPLLSSHYEEARSAVKGKSISLGFDIHYSSITETKTASGKQGVKNATIDINYSFEAEYNDESIETSKVTVIAVVDVTGLSTNTKISLDETFDNSIVYSYDASSKPTLEDASKYTERSLTCYARYETPYGTSLYSQHGPMDSSALPEFYSGFSTDVYYDKECTRLATGLTLKSYDKTYYYKPVAQDATKVSVIVGSLGRVTDSDEYSSYVGNNGGRRWTINTLSEDGTVAFETWDYKDTNTGVTSTYKVDSVDIIESDDPDAKWENGKLTAKAGSYVILTQYGTQK